MIQTQKYFAIKCVWFLLATSAGCFEATTHSWWVIQESMPETCCCYSSFLWTILWPSDRLFEWPRREQVLEAGKFATTSLAWCGRCCCDWGTTVQFAPKRAWLPCPSTAIEGYFFRSKKITMLPIIIFHREVRGGIATGKCDTCAFNLAAEKTRQTLQTRLTTWIKISKPWLIAVGLWV